MLAYDCENIPVKEDTSATTTESNNINNNNNAINGPAGRFNTHIQQKTKYIRDMWTQHRIRINKDNSQLVVIVLLSLFAIGCSIAALTSNNWTCDPQTNVRYGLWNTCFKPINNRIEIRIAPSLPIILNDTETMVTNNETDVIINGTKSINSQEFLAAENSIVCAHQALNEIKIVYAEQTRIDQVSASQGLIISGTILYIFSIISISLAYKFIRVNNLNSVRNALVTSMCVQIVSFFMQLIGFFLFILTDRLSISIGLLFVYFGLAIFATNIINFITIEYKSYKIRQISI